MTVEEYLQGNMNGTILMGGTTSEGNGVFLYATDSKEKVFTASFGGLHVLSTVSSTDELLSVAMEGRSLADYAKGVSADFVAIIYDENEESFRYLRKKGARINSWTYQAFKAFAHALDESKTEDPVVVDFLAPLSVVIDRIWKNLPSSYTFASVNLGGGERVLCR